jgi:hypothetical protein
MNETRSDCVCHHVDAGEFWECMQSGGEWHQHVRESNQSRRLHGSRLNSRSPEQCRDEQELCVPAHLTLGTNTAFVPKAAGHLGCPFVKYTRCPKGGDDSFASAASEPSLFFFSMRTNRKKKKKKKQSTAEV